MAIFAYQSRLLTESAKSIRDASKHNDLPCNAGEV